MVGYLRVSQVKTASAAHTYIPEVMQGHLYVHTHNDSQCSISGLSYSSVSTYMGFIRIFSLNQNALPE